MAEKTKLVKKARVGAAGGWGSVRGIAEVYGAEHPVPGVYRTLFQLNKPGGTMCTSCAWGKPAKPGLFEVCENGAKATIWDLTSDRCTPEFFAEHSLADLRSWSDHDLEMQGRLTEPLRYDADSDRYVRCGWDEAFAGIGAALRRLEPQSVVFYASGRASLETSYLYALFARLYGHNNLPDSSNMCHETTSVSLKEHIGTPVGTCVLDDFEHCDAIFYFGQNPATNSGRFLHPLQKAVRRGCRLIVFNPVIEKGLLEFIDPQNPVEMLTGTGTRLAHQYLQVKAGGDIAAIIGVCKHLLELDEAALQQGKPGILDRAFLEEHCHRSEAFLAQVRATAWEDIEAHSGLSRDDLSQAATVYAEAERVIGVYGMGLTQHVHGSQAIGTLLNLLFLRGNIGRPGAGICPVRGHSNVQGQRTVGISEKPELIPLERLAELFDFDPPREHGLATVDACEAIRAGTVKAFVALGGNFLRAIPEQEAMEQAWVKQELTVSIATKLNRSHLFPGKEAWLLPCLVRSEIDVQASGPQVVTIEDSFSHIHVSNGRHSPASPHLRSELAIVAGMAKATLAPNPRCDWDAWVADYGKVRDLIAATYPEFHDFNARLQTPGGFYRGNPARERRWQTASGKAEFTLPSVLSSLGIGDAPGRYHLITMRSNDQFNTTIYGYSDRLRGLEGSRMLLLMNADDMAAAGLYEGQEVSLVSDAGDETARQVDGLRVTTFALPRGCVGGYYPELNPLIPLWYHDEHSKTPAAKGVPVRIQIGGEHENGCAAAR
ncbi:formate dehydrogenase [Acidithiobacillus caldus]|uniref:Formate dehydrogenase n=1 Tax=Acidithiobacillus caldus TaxID=33059 RepID=A0A1E7YXJ2_9PROT|nr:formate dehydrogenase [Acidithiobacillus caldus]